MMPQKTSYVFLLLLWACVWQGATAADTLRVNLHAADSIFMADNYVLLAQTMRIEREKALVIQASLYPNPIVTADFTAVDPENGKFFRLGANGQKGFQLEQLLLLGGKRKAAIDLAQSNATLAELEFQDLIRRLRFRLRSDLFAIGQQQFLLGKYNQQLALLDTLLSNFQTQVERGNLPLKDLVRLKGAYLKLNNDRAELFKHYYQAQANLQVLLSTQALVDFQFSEAEIARYINPKPLDELLAEMYAHRPDFRILRQERQLAEQYLRYQRALAIPDLNLFSFYDQRGGAFQNQVNIGIAMPLPLFNRNQGAIKAAECYIKEQDYRVQAFENEMRSELLNAFRLYTQTVQEYRRATTLYSEDFELTTRGMVDNFQKRNVSIVEFIDFFEAYNEVLTELVRIRIQLVASGEELNLIIGKDVY